MGSDWEARAEESILDLLGATGEERALLRPAVELAVTLLCRALVAIRAKH